VEKRERAQSVAGVGRRPPVEGGAVEHHLAGQHGVGAQAPLDNLQPVLQGSSAGPGGGEAALCEQCRAEVGLSPMDCLLPLHLTWIIEVVACSQHEPQYCGPVGEGEEGTRNGSGPLLVRVRGRVLCSARPTAAHARKQAHLRNVLIPGGGLRV
jgi:hypothetical protein